MKNRYCIFALLVVISLVLLSGCSVVSAFGGTETPTQTLQPTNTVPPTVTPTATQVPFYVDALVWDSKLKVPILIYHQFVPDYGNTDATKMRLADFRDQLQQYYDNGFSLIPLKSWLDGTFTLPEGKKPLVITLDDLWFGNQIYIRDDGSISPNSGLGVLWQFSQDHPDFGFHAALFAINGDKYYPEKEVDGAFYAADGVDFYSKSWHIKLGQTVAWALDHGLEVYNHTFEHPWNWPQIDNASIKKQLESNDYWLRKFLEEAGRQDLIPGLDNMIALPEGKWPEAESGKRIVLEYKNDEDEPVLAIMEAYNMDMPQLTPSKFDPAFDPFHIARITASKFMTQYVIEHKDLVPTMIRCQLGPLEEAQAGDLNVIQSAIQTAISTGACPEGIYNVNGTLFIGQNGAVTLYTPQQDAQVTPTVAP